MHCKKCLTDQGFYVTVPAGLKHNKTFPLGTMSQYNLNYNKGWFAAGFIDAHTLKKDQATFKLFDMGPENGKFHRAWIALFRDINFNTLNLTGRTLRLTKKYLDIKPSIDDLSPETMADYCYGYLIYELSKYTRDGRVRGKLLFKHIPNEFSSLIFRLLNMYFVYDEKGAMRISYSSLGTFLRYLPADNIVGIRGYKYVRAIKLKRLTRAQIIKQEDVFDWWIPGMTPDINNLCTDEKEDDIWLPTTSKNKISRHFFYDFEDIFQ